MEGQKANSRRYGAEPSCSRMVRKKPPSRTRAERDLRAQPRFLILQQIERLVEGGEGQARDAATLNLKSDKDRPESGQGQ